MRNFTCLVAIVLACSGLLTGCGKPPHSGSSSNPSPPASANTGVSPSATATKQSSPLAAQTLADRLLASGFAPDQDGFTILHPLACEPAGKDDEGTVRCHASFADDQRHGQPAFVEIQLFDRDVPFAQRDKPLKDHVAGLSGRWSLDIDPDITVTRKSTGVKTKLDGACHQSLGHANSPAFCAILFTPRIFIISGVKPAHSSSTSVTMAPGDGPDPNAQDINHAKELAVLLIAMIGGSL
jgi:hypothetical protein